MPYDFGVEGPLGLGYNPDDDMIEVRDGPRLLCRIPRVFLLDTLRDFILEHPGFAHFIDEGAHPCALCFYREGE